MAPEQMTSAEAVGPAADLYSLSVMFYELLMDAPPQGALRAGQQESGPDVPQAIDELIEKGLSVRAKSRYLSAQDYGIALDKALAAPVVPVGGDVKPPPVHVVPETKPWWQYKGLWATATPKQKGLIVAGTAVLVIITAALMQDNEAPAFTDDDLYYQSSDDFTDPADDLGPGGNTGGSTGGNTGSGSGQAGNAFNPGGYWMDLFGNRFAVTYQGSAFTATGSVVNLGVVQIMGTINQSNAEFMVTSQAGFSAPGIGNVFQDEVGRWHMNYTLQDGMGTTGQFHMNHSHSN